MDEYNNIYNLESNLVFIDKPDNFAEIREKVIFVIKEYNLSLSQSAMLFNSIIKKLGNTPINDL